MGKISPVSIKYTIFAKFEAVGVVEKPDVIGALFGQTEGLLGEELELRDLQKNGKIGRIDVDLKTEESKTTGEIRIPTSLDKAETTIIAAAIETIERVGPCDAKVKIDRIDDVRGSKRDYVIERAKKLLAEMSSPDSREIESEVSESVKTARIIEFGDEKLPAGPDTGNEEIIVVEGRADVVNLLKYGIKNTIAMDGASLPKTIKELGESKKLILFIDGDRGGLLIAKDAMATAKIFAVAEAPAGKEVEELAGKEILTCLRAKIPAEEFKRQRLEVGGETKRYGRRARREPEERVVRREQEERVEKEEPEKSEDERINVFREKMGEIEGTRAALLMDSGLNILGRISASEIGYAMRRSRGRIYAVIFDGLATNSMIRMAEMARCKYFVAKNFSVSQETTVNLLSL